MKLRLKNLTPKMLESVIAAYQFRDTPLTDFRDDAKAYLKALKQGRLLMQVIHTSEVDGASRFVSVKSCEKNPGGESPYAYYGFAALLAVFGYPFHLGHWAHEVQGVDVNHRRILNGAVLDGLHRFGLITQEDRCDLMCKVP